MNAATVICPAKINLFLAVGPPDESGYHPLRTIFQAISLCDELAIQTIDGSKDLIECDWPGLPVVNTLTKTLKLAREIALIPPLHIQLSKNIPTQAGLGGGSSNAAGLLRWLGRESPVALPPHTLRDIAFSVGADVSFFLVGGLAWAEGYGEKLHAMHDLARLHLVIVKPGHGTSTVDAYRALDFVFRPWREFPTDPLDTWNDFELVSPPETFEMISSMKEVGAEKAGLCGSGSCVYGLFMSHEEASAASQALTRFGHTYQATTLTREESLWIR